MDGPENKVTIYTDVVPDPPITHVVKGIEFMERYQTNRYHCHWWGDPALI